MTNPLPLEKLAKLCDSLKGTNLQSRTREEIREEMLQLTQGHRFLGVSRSAEQIWYRCRKCKDRDGFDNVSEMIYPPEGSPTYGRANLPGQRVLYAGWNRRTALEESSPEVGDIFQLIALRVQPGIQVPCHAIGEYQRVLNSGRSYSNLIQKAVIEEQTSHPELIDTRLFIDSFFAEQYRRITNRSVEYKFTALFANEIFAAGHGIMYPSVVTPHAINLAVSSDVFDVSFEVLFTEVFEVKKYYGHGVYEQKTLKRTLEIADGGAFVWNSKREVNFDWSLESGMRIPHDFRGWRVAARSEPVPA